MTASPAGFSHGNPDAHQAGTFHARGWRSDIQLLRGLAVCMVILFHTGLGIAPSGYLGVDIFFVVSGYLIGGIVMRDRSAGVFTFGGFYRRRVRRLAPAGFVTLAAVLAAAALLMTPGGYARFWPQLLGALTFSTNMVLWRQINYFNDSAQSEPLLHVWSLAVEEQFYLLFPVALMLCPWRWWWPVMAAATAASLVAYLALYPESPGATFYLLPTRAWAIGLGVLAIEITDRPACVVALAGLRPLSVLTVLLVPFVPPFAHSHWLALPACLATAIIVASPPAATDNVGWAIGAAIGDRSYALYLVHWPFFAFATMIHLGAPLPPTVSILLVALTFASGELLFRYVETPLRHMHLSPNALWTAFAATTILLAALGGWVLHAKRTAATGLDLAGVTGLDLPGCSADTATFDGRCSQSSAPRILVWGDSFSQALVPALVATSPRAIAQASQGGCAPLPGYAPIDLNGPLRTARRCLAFNASVLAYLSRTPSIDVVLMSGRYLRYALPGTKALHRDADGREIIGTPDPAALALAQERTNAVIRALGKRVILVTGPPQADFDVGQCWERHRSGLPLVSTAPDCAIVAANTHPQAAWADRWLHTVAAHGTPIVSFDVSLCRAGICRTTIDGVPLYRDAGHFSRTGSILVGRRLGLGERVWRTAH